MLCTPYSFRNTLHTGPDHWRHRSIRCVMYAYPKHHRSHLCTVDPKVIYQVVSTKSRFGYINHDSQSIYYYVRKYVFMYVCTEYVCTPYSVYGVCICCTFCHLEMKQKQKRSANTNKQTSTFGIVRKISKTNFAEEMSQMSEIMLKETK